MTYTPEKLAELKAVAKAATPGPWVWRTANSTNELISLDERGRPARIIAYGRGYPSSVSIQACNQSHISTFDPPQVLALIEEIERLRDAMPKLVDALRCFLEDQRFHVAVGGNPIAVEKMIAEARAAVEAGEELGGQKDG